MQSKFVQYLSVDEVLEIHTAVIERFGGSDGVRDKGLLESALYRPQSGYYADLAEMAAAMFESLIINHPFNDGNNGVAFFSTDEFIILNGYNIFIDPIAANYFLMKRFASNTCDLEHIGPWLRTVISEL